MTGIVDWLVTHLPTKDSIATNRWLAPFAHHLLHPSLWKFNRRSVPRGVALGLVAGLATPFAHTFVAAGLAVPLRANIVIASATTWVSNPLTWILIFPAEHAIGRFLVHLFRHAPAPDAAVQAGVAVQGWLAWLLRATGEVALGGIVLATAAGFMGYALVTVIWRLRVARKWRRRARG
jgi:uncharacterized protein